MWYVLLSYYLLRLRSFSRKFTTNMYTSISQTGYQFFFWFFRKFGPKIRIDVACLQNGYNLPLMVTVTTIVSPGKKSGLECGNPHCGININSFCQSPNKITGGPGDGCYNVDGPTATSPTNGTEVFANACPDAFSYSTDNANHVYFCQTGSEYAVVFCPIPFKLDTVEWLLVRYVVAPAESNAWSEIPLLVKMFHQ